LGVASLGTPLGGKESHQGTKGIELDCLSAARPPSAGTGKEKKVGSGATAVGIFGEELLGDLISGATSHRTEPGSEWNLDDRDRGGFDRAHRSCFPESSADSRRS